MSEISSAPAAAAAAVQSEEQKEDDDLDLFDKVEKTEDRIEAIMSLFCDVQEEICQEMVKQRDETYDIMFNDLQDSVGDAQTSQHPKSQGGQYGQQQTLESKILQIGDNLKAIQAGMHEVVNTISTLESTKQRQTQLLRPNPPAIQPLQK